MANNLTWRDVAPPDFSGSMAAYKIAGDAITNAGKTAMDALDKFDAGRKADAANAIYQASMGYGTPDALRAAIADGSLYAKAGVNPGLITADANKALDSRASTLLSQATAQTALDHSKVMNPLLQTNQGLQNTNQGLQNEHQKLNNQFDAANMPTKLEQNKASLASTQAGTARTVQDTSQSKIKFENDQADREEEANAVKAAEQAARGAVTTKDAIAALNANTSLDESTRAAALGKLPGLVKQYNPDDASLALPNAAQSATAPAARPGASPGSAPAAIAAATTPMPGKGRYSTSQMAALIRQVGGSPEEAQMLAAIASGESGGNPLAHNPNAKTGDNSFGLWQINMLGNLEGERLKKFGLKSKEELFDPQVNARVALQMARERGGYNDWSVYKNGLHKKYMGDAATGASNPDSVGMPDLRQQNQALDNRAAALISGATTRANQENAGGIQGIVYGHTKADGTYVPGTQDDTDTTMGDAVTKLKNGKFKNVSHEAIQKKLNDIITESKTEGRKPVTIATAAAILDNTGYASDRGWYNPARWFGDGSTIESYDDAKTSELTKIGQGKSDETRQGNNANAAIAQALQTAVAAKNAAYNELVRTQEAVRGGRPQVAATLSDKMDNYNRASAALEQLLQANEVKAKGGSMTPLFKKPQEK